MNSDSRSPHSWGWVSLALLALLASLWFYAGARVTGQSANGKVTVVSAASYATLVAPDSIVALFGQNLATKTEIATSQPLPKSLAGTTVKVNGELAQLFFVSAGQINFLIPKNAPSGELDVVVTAGNGAVSSGKASVAQVAPGLLTADASGRGPLASVQYLYKKNGGVVSQPLSKFDGTKFVTNPINLGEPGDRLFLALSLTGIRSAAASGVKISIGGVDYPASYVGPVDGFAGLDQVNVELPRSFAGRGPVALFVKAAGYGSSNAGEIEVVSAANLSQEVIITQPIDHPLLAGEELEIIGEGFSANGDENFVQIESEGDLPAKAQVLAVTGTSLRVRTPYGAFTGKLWVRRGSSEASVDVKVRNSVSGFAEEVLGWLPDGRCRCKPIAGAKVSLFGLPIETVSGPDGSFVLPDSPVGSRIVQIVPPDNIYATELVVIDVQDGRDNQLKRGLELARSGNTQFPFNSELGFISPQSPEAILTFLSPGRTPANLTIGHFSTAIAQITPFGQSIPPATRLSFPNSDAIPVGANPRLFKFDQNPNSATIGQFIDIGQATVSADGQRVETAAGAITEGSYYFVSTKRSTGLINGRVVERDGRPVPRAIVQTRGQSVFTDGHGGFVLREVPVMKSNGDQVRVEVSYQRPDGSVSRKQSDPVEISAGNLATIVSEIVLDAPVANFPPAILVPTNLRLSAGEIRDFDFAVVVADSSTPSVTLSGNATAFVTLTATASGHRLRIAPTAEGSFSLTINASNNFGSSRQTLAITVAKADNAALTVQEQSLVTPEDTPRQITLTGRDPIGRALVYSIVAMPSRGSLSGVAPNLVYTPGLNFNGVDSFEFKISNGITESRAAKVFVVVNPVNDPPELTIVGASEIKAGETVNLIVSAMDVDAQPLALTVGGKPADATVTELTSSSWRFSWTPLALQAGSHKFSFKVEDNGTPRLSNTKEFALSVKAQDLTQSKWAKTFGLEGGSVTALVASGSNLFAGTYDGGIFLSVNQGQSWVPVNNGLGNLSVSVLAQNGGRLFAGTSNGIFASDNNGQTWRLLALSGVITRNLVVTADRVYAWTSAEEFYSVDNGATWRRLRPELPSGYNGEGIVVASDGTIYTPGRIGPPYRTTLLRLRSGEQAWQRIDAELPSSLETTYEFSGFFAWGSTLIYSYSEYRQSGSVQRYFLSLDQGDHWQEINPTRTGRTVQFLFVFQGKLFLGLGYGGLLSSTDNGRSWQQEKVSTLSDDPSASRMLNIGSTLFVGLNGYYSSPDSSVGVGVHRSTDSGRTWNEVNTGLTNGGNLPVLLNGEMDVYAPARQNLFASGKLGQSWRKREKDIPLSFSASGRVIAVEGSTLLACCGGKGMLLSKDNGQNWSEIDPQALKLQDPVSAVAIRRDSFYVGGFGEVMISNNAGRNWQSVSKGFRNYNWRATNLVVDDNNVYAVMYGAGTSSLISQVYQLGNQGQEPAWIEVGPKDGIVGEKLTAFTAFGDRFYGGTESGAIYVSMDKGRSWKVYDGVLPRVAVQSLALIGNTLFAGSASGVFFSNDNGQSWKPFTAGMTDTRVTSLIKRGDVLFASTSGGSVFRLEANVQDWSQSNAGLTNTFTNAIAFSNNNLFAGSLGSGVFRSSNGGRTWAQFSAGLPANANVNVSSFAVGSGADATVWVGLFGDGVYRSDNQGVNWTAFNTGLSNKLVNAVLANGSTLYAGTDGGVFRSVDGGNWAAINTGLSSSRVISFVADGNSVYAGTDGGGVFKLIAESGSWTRVSNGLMNSYVTALFVNRGALYAGTGGGGVYVSRDGGQNWTPINDQLPPVLNVYAFAASGQKLYAGTVYGVFVTEDEGRNWKQVNAGLLDVYVTGLAVSGNTLYGGTARGGLFTSAIP